MVMIIMAHDEIPSPPLPQRSSFVHNQHLSLLRIELDWLWREKIGYLWFSMLSVRKFRTPPRRIRLGYTRHPHLYLHLSERSHTGTGR